MKNGETRSGPRSRRTSCCSTIPGRPPIAEPTTMPTGPGRRPFSAGVAPRLLRRAEREQDVAVHPARLLRRRDRGGVEALHLAGDPDRELARVEGLDEVDAALARDGGLPGRRRVEPDRRDRAQPGDGDPSHRPILEDVASRSGRAFSRGSARSRPTSRPPGSTASTRPGEQRRGSAARARRRRTARCSGPSIVAPAAPSIRLRTPRAAAAGRRRARTSHRRRARPSQ